MTIYKKNNKYYCRFQIDGERHHYLCSGASSASEAKKIEDGFKYKVQQQQNGIISKNSQAKIKLKKLITLYDEYGDVNKLSHSRNSFGKIIGAYFGVETDISSIKPDKIEKFKNYLRSERKSTNSTINKYISALSKMYNLGISNKLITYNPVNEVKKLREDNFKIRYLTKDEEIRMFKCVSVNCEHLKPIIICALQTGMRKGEILNLRWSNIDFELNFIEILKTKTGKARKIPISETLLKILNEQPVISEYVFVNKYTEKPYTDIHNSFATVCKTASIPNFRFHDIRHTVATRLVEKGIDLIVVKEILGHSKIDTTMRYAHAVPKRKLEAIEVLNSYN